MKFREWLKNIEEAQLRNRVPSANTDPTTSWGAAAQYGGSRALLPISYGIDNRAFAGVLDGIGIARKKIQDETGAEPGSASQYSGLEDVRRSNLQVAYMPLQYPEDYTEDQVLSFNRGLVTKARITAPSGDPLSDPSIYNVDESKSKLRPFDKNMMVTKLLKVPEGRTANSNTYASSIKFAMALIHASFMTRLEKFSHLLNLEKPNIKEKKVVPFVDDFGREGKKIYYVLICAFEFLPRSKDTTFDNDIHDEIDAAINDRNGTTTTQQAPTKQPTQTNTQAVSPVSGGKP